MKNKEMSIHRESSFVLRKIFLRLYASTTAVIAVVDSRIQ